MDPIQPVDYTTRPAPWTDTSGPYPQGITLVDRASDAQYAASNTLETIVSDLMQRLAVIRGLISTTI